MNAPEVRRVIEDLEAEVNNGGFNQYFFNAAGNDAAAAMEALDTIGAAAAAALLTDACAKFPGGMPTLDRFRRQEDLERADPDDEAFQALDDAFYASPDDLAALLAVYEARALPHAERRGCCTLSLDELPYVALA